MKKILFTLMIVHAVVTKLNAQVHEKYTDSILDKIKPFLNVYGGGNYLYHHILDSAEYRTNVKYDSKDWGQYQFQADAGFLGYSVLAFSYERTFPHNSFTELAVRENFENVVFERIRNNFSAT
jgi:hypothetical protein